MVVGPGEQGLLPPLLLFNIDPVTPGKLGCPRLSLCRSRVKFYFNRLQLCRGSQCETYYGSCGPVQATSQAMLRAKAQENHCTKATDQINIFMKSVCHRGAEKGQ